MKNEIDFKKKIVKDTIRIRISQMLINEEYKQGKFKIPIHLAFGHEAVAVAVNEIMDNKDKLVLTHRNIEYNLGRKGSIKAILNEYKLKEEGLTEGKLGSMNLINREKGIVYSSSILGNNFSVSTGIAFAEIMKKSEGITIVLGGDGSIEEGSFHESLLMAKSLNLPMLFIIENNEWSMSTKIDERRSSVNWEKFAQSYEIKYHKLEGNDPMKYINNLSSLKNYAISHSEPIFVEVILGTLGDWIKKGDPDYPNGKFINYHAGPAPTIDIEHCPIFIKNEEKDPIFVLLNYFSNTELDNLTKEVRDEINMELK
jgi:TPP-dependent pyruvate/acetoin dehydrogenase alpha subunit